MRHAGQCRGMSLIELLIATSIGVLVSGLIIQVMVLTMRTSEQTATQADTQQQARVAMAEWERELRDAYAVLTSYTSPTTFESFTTQVTATEQTIVAALPSLDGSGNLCTWRGYNVVFDCVVWKATQAADGTWQVTRYTYPNAFQMPANYLTARAGGDDPFRSLVWGSTPGYTVPSSFARAADPTPARVLSRASTLSVELWGSATRIVPSGSVVYPPRVTTQVTLPFYTDATGIRTNTPIAPTGVCTLKLSLRFAKTAAALASGRGSVTTSDTQSLAVDLRNRPNW